MTNSIKSGVFCLVPCVVWLTCGCGERGYVGPVADSRAAIEIRKALDTSSGSEGEGGAADAASSGTGWATLKGRFAFDGNPPTMSPYDVTKDQATCTANGKAPLQQTLLVDSATKGIKNVVVFVRNAPRVHESAGPSKEPVLYDQKECVFVTHVLPLTVGQPLQLKNSDNVGHNTNIRGKKNTFNQTIPAGASIPFVPQKEEALPAPVNCSIHPWMSAYMLPRKNSYYAVTGEDGTFEIPNLPAGEELEIQVWHESATGPGGGLVLSTPEAKANKWSKKGRFKIQLKQDETKEINLNIPETAFRS